MPDTALLQLLAHKIVPGKLTKVYEEGGCGEGDASGIVTRYISLLWCDLKYVMTAYFPSRGSIKMLCVLLDDAVTPSLSFIRQLCVQ